MHEKALLHVGRTAAAALSAELGWNISFRIQDRSRDGADDSTVVPVATGAPHGGEFVVPPAGNRLPPPEILAVVRAAAAVLGVFTDYELQVQSAEERARHAERLAREDPLTGVGNRRSWDEALAVEEARRLRTGQPVTVMVIDLDGLKAHNDTLGHPAGDVLLAQTAATLRAVVRPTDVIARLGGDEFGVVLPACPAEEATTVAERLEARLDRRRLPASIGWAVAGDGTTVEEAWHRADRRMYDAKAAAGAGGQIP